MAHQSFGLGISANSDKENRGDHHPENEGPYQSLRDRDQLNQDQSMGDSRELKFNVFREYHLDNIKTRSHDWSQEEQDISREPVYVVTPL